MIKHSPLPTSSPYWDRLIEDSFKIFNNEVHKVKEQAILNLLALGASLADLEWDGNGDLIHKPTGFGYSFRTEAGEGWVQYYADPVVRR